MRWIRSYIKYLANEKKEIQRVHAVFIAAILTAIFTGAYLYILYDIAPPTPDIKISNSKTYVRDASADENIVYEASEGSVLKEETLIPPENSIYKIADMFVDLQFRIKELKAFFQTGSSYSATSTNEN